MMAVNTLQLLQVVAQIHIAQHNTTGRIAIQVIRQEYFVSRSHRLGILLAKVIAEPARQLKFQQTDQAFGPHTSGTLPPDRRSILAIPGRGVDESQRAHSRMIQARQRLSYASTHRTARGYSSLPADMIELASIRVAERT